MIDISSNIASVNIALSQVNLGANLGPTVKRLATKLWRELQAATPVDTGRARSGWVALPVKPALWEISNNVEYVPDLEYGTNRSQKHVGFIRRTVAKFGDEALYEIRAAVRKAMP